MDPLEELIRAQPGLSISLTILGLVVGSFLIEKFLSSDPLREISDSIKPLIDELKNE